MIDFFIKIEERWAPMGSEPIKMGIIGSSALFLQTDYVRGTSDTDVLEIGDLSGKVSEQLLKIAGKGTSLAQSQRLYIDIVGAGIPFLPPKPIFNPLKIKKPKLRFFELQVLDPLDVVISKLKTFRPHDVDDIHAMAERDVLDPALLVKRFELAKDQWLLGSRAGDLPRYIENLHTIQRDFLFVKETPIELPDWVMEA